MKGLRAEIKLAEGVINWTVHPEASSAILALPSQHIAVNITEGLDDFLEQVPESAAYARTKEHDRASAAIFLASVDTSRFYEHNGSPSAAYKPARSEMQTS
jgi:hypothetical protein